MFALNTIKKETKSKHLDMAYPFKKVPHCVYKNTFLKDVRMAVAFPAVSPSSLKVEPLREFFQQFIGADIQIEDFLRNGYINIFSTDHFIDLKFSLSYAEVKISAQKYTSFELAKSYWQMLYDFLAAICIDSVSKLVLRKFNALYFKAESQYYDVQSVMDEVFCDELMALMADVDKEGALNSIEKTQTFEDAKTNTLLTAVFGIKKSDTSEKNDHLTLVTTVESNQGPVPVGELPTCAEQYNQILFDAFHWCVKDSIIQNMK